MKRILFCWTMISGYMASCWKSLSKESDINIFVLCLKTSGSSNVAFSMDLMKEIPYKLLDHSEIDNYQLITQIISEQKPDYIIISGWNIKSYNKIAFDANFKTIPKILAFDNQLHNNFRQAIGRLLLKSYINKISVAFVPGLKTKLYAKYLGFADNNIITGLYGFDNEYLNDIWKVKNNNNNWPKSFLYTGQYIKRKGIDILIKSFIEYQKRVLNPWPLFCCGMGPYNTLLNNIKGITNYGFKQPHELKNILLNVGVYILPSRYDSWGVTIAENCAAGLPIICTDKCGASFDLVRHNQNGLIIKSNDIQSLTNALIWMTKNHHLLPKLGEKSLELSSYYGSRDWSKKIKMIIDIIKQ